MGLSSASRSLTEIDHRWHSVVGLGIYVIVRDVYDLVRDALVLQEMSRRRVADFPFTDVKLDDDTELIADA